MVRPILSPVLSPPPPPARPLPPPPAPPPGEEGRAEATLNLGAQIHSELTRKGLDFNIMLVGEAGLGKSTFVRSLFRPFSPPGSDPWLAPSEEVLRPRTVGISEHTLALESDGYPLNLCAPRARASGARPVRARRARDRRASRPPDPPVCSTIIDCPGYGDSVDANESIEPILAAIRAKFAQHYDALLGGGADHGSRLGRDGRVHVCLYFIAAHRLKGIDIQFMRALQTCVPIVPLIAKADTLTRQEKEAFRAQIIRELSAQEVECLAFEAAQQPLPREQGAPGHAQPPLRSRSSGGMGSPAPVPPSRLVSLQALGAPFAVCASESGVREYPWGTADCEDPAHSDLARLREVLLSANLMRARERTHELYEQAYASGRRAADAAAARALRLRLERQERALRLGLALGAGCALVLLAARLRAALPAARLVQLDRTAAELGTGLAGAGRATVRGVNAYALSPIARAAEAAAGYASPAKWARALARRLED